MSRNNNLDQFDELIDDLQRSGERPFAPHAFKNQLRTQLMDQYQNRGFSLATLGRMAGTAVAIGVLGFIVINALGILSRPELTGSPIQVTRPVQPTPQPTISTEPPESAISSFMGDPLLKSHQLSATQVNPGDTLDVTLFWEGEVAADTAVAVHLTNASGQLFAQADQPLTGEMMLSLLIPESLADGVYELVVIKYNTESGVRQDSFLLQEIGVGTAVANPTHAPNDVWLINARQQSRTSANDPVKLEITVGYQFDVDETVTLKPLYAHPEWETAVGGRLPLDGFGDEIVLNGKTGAHTFIVSQDPAMMREIVGTDQPVLVMQLAYQDITEDGSNRINILAMPTFSQIIIDLNRTEEMQFTGDRLWIEKATQRPRNNPDEPITLEVTVGYELVTADEAVLSVGYWHLSEEIPPLYVLDLGYNGLFGTTGLSDDYPIQAGPDFLTFTATIDPGEITSAINSDEFVLITKIGSWTTDESGQQTFELILFGFDKSMPFNVQTVEEITYP